MKPAVKLSKSCPECGSDAIYEDHNTGELGCLECGYVLLAQGVDMGPEWRKFDDEKDSGRSGPPLTILYGDLSTTISGIKKGRNELSDLSKVHRLRTWQKRVQTQDAENRHMTKAVAFFENYADKLRLPSYVVESAMSLYRRFYNTKLIRGRAIKYVVPAAVYAACRLNYIPRDLKQVAQVRPNVTEKIIGRDYRLLYNTLNLKVPVPNPKIYLGRIASEAHLSQETINAAIGLLDKASDTGVQLGKGPVGMAAAALYLARRESEGHITQKTLSDASGLTEVTIRNRSKELKQKLEGLEQLLETM